MDLLRRKLGLDLEGRAHTASSLSKLKGVSTFFEEALKAGEKVKVAEALLHSAPWWSEALGSALAQSVPLIKFVVTFVAELTKIKDPNELGFLACTLAYQRATAEIFQELSPELALPAGADQSALKLAELDFEETPDFRGFSLRNASNHPFTMQAEKVLEAFCASAGISPDDARKLKITIRHRFASHLKTLLSHAESADKFKPFKEFMGLTKEEVAYDHLMSHVEYCRYLFEEAPLLDSEPYPLKDVYLDTECGKLAWGDVKRRNEGPSTPSSKPQATDPFHESACGRADLLETVLELLGDPKLDEPILIHGVAGSGKSSFTLKLSVELAKRGLIPLRVRLRDLALDRHISDALPNALLTGDFSYGSAAEDPFQKGAIFDEMIEFGNATICPYVIILDGWDEINISAAEGLKVRTERMLEQVRNEYLRRRGPKIRVILTGRPSLEIQDSTFPRENTPLLVLRPIAPEQLEEFVDRLRIATTERPISMPDWVDWKPASNQELRPVFRQYRQGFDRSLSKEARSDDATDQLEVLGLPLLCFLAIRLISQWPDDRAELLQNPTMLYRSMINLTCDRAGKETDAATEQMDLVTGLELRRLLHKTAVAMTCFGEESIGYQELSLRIGLPFDDALSNQVDRVTRKHNLSALLVAFFFKSGNTSLGCEFLHKSFREYLYAEAIVEVLKEYGRAKGDTAAGESARSHYFEDFHINDGLYGLSRELSEILAPQWMSKEVARHLSKLIDEEIAEAAKLTDDRGTEQESIGSRVSPACISEWQIIRDALAQLWDWWGDGAHLRPQVVRERGQIRLEPCYAEGLVDHDLPYNRSNSGSRPIAPARVLTMDAHLGDGLFRLCCWVHGFLAWRTGWWAPESNPKAAWAKVSPASAEARPQYQSEIRRDGTVWRFFRPGGGGDYFAWYANRINSAGWRPEGDFPAGVEMSAVDLRGSFIQGVRFQEPRIETFKGANFAGVQFECCILQDVTFNRCLLTDVEVNGTSLLGCEVFECVGSIKLLYAIVLHCRFFGISLPLEVNSDSLLKNCMLDGEPIPDGARRHEEFVGPD